MTSSSPPRRRVLRDLLLAMLNATLILVALCLFLGLRLAGTVDGITERLAGNVASMAPLRGEISTLTEELRGLRADLATATAGTGALTSQSADALKTRVAALDARIEVVLDGVGRIGDRVGAAAADPAVLIDTAIRSATDQAAQNLAGLAGCALPPPAAGGTVPSPSVASQGS